MVEVLIGDVGGGDVDVRGEEFLGWVILLGDIIGG